MNDQHMPATPGGTGEHPVQPVKLWPASGRMGRLRVLAWSLGLNVLLAVLAGILGAAGLPGVVPVLLLPVLVISWSLLVQRSHDMNLSGWWSLAALIPLIGLAWLIVPGTHGTNRFGPPPEPNTLGVKILAWGALLVIPVGILAAIALPAYSDYQVKARVAETLTALQPCQAKVSMALSAGSAAAAPRAGQWGCVEGSDVGRWGTRLHVDDDGAINVTVMGTGSNRVDGRVLQLVPVDGSQRVLSAKDMPAIPAGFRCRQAPGHGLEAKWMPASCRL